MAVIKQRVFVEGVQDGCLCLTNEDFVRPLAIGTTWNSIRITALIGFDQPNPGTYTFAGLFMGVCSGQTAPFGAASTTNFVGALLTSRVGSPANWELVYTANSGNPYLSGTFGNAAYTKVGSTGVSSSTNTSPCAFPVAGVGTARRGLVYVTITKGSPNYQIYTAAPSVTTDQTMAMFYEAIDQATAVPNVGGLSSYTGNIGIAASEAPGPFNTVNISWNRSFPVEIYCLAVTRIS